MATIASLIVDLAANTAKLQSDVEKVGAHLNKIEGFASKAKTALIGMVSIGAISAAISRFTDLTGRLTDLSLKTGISTTELQKLKFAAEQNGGTLEQVTNAIARMARGLVDGDKGVVAGIKRLGLNFAEVRQMQPGEAFALIGDKIAGVKSPLEQAALAMTIFGKSGADMLPMLKGQLHETMLAAERLGIVLDEQTVAAGDELGDVLAVLQSAGMAMLAQVLKPMLPAFVELAKAISGVGNVITWLQNGFQKLIEWGLRAFKTLVDGSIRVGELAAKIPVLGKALQALDGNTLQSAKSMSVWLDDTIKAMQREIPKAEAPVHTMRTAIGTIPKVAQEATRELTQMEKAITAALHRALERANVELLKTANALPHLTNMVRASRETLLLELPAIESTTNATVNFGQQLLETAAKGGIFKEKVFSLGEYLKNHAAPATRTWRDHLDEVARSLEQLATVAGQAFGDIVRSIATMVVAMKTADDGLKSIKNGMKDWKAGNTWEGILGITSGVLGLTSAAISAGKALFNLFDRDKGRDLVEKFAAEFGGFDALHRILNQLGNEGERLWIMLTQGVGRNNPEQAQRAIEEVRKAIEGLSSTVNAIPRDVDIDIGVNTHGIREGEPNGSEGGFASGTPGLDYVDFGRATPGVTMHGDEAVVPRSRVGEFAAQVAAALAGVIGGDTHVYIGNEQLDARMVKTARRAASTGLLRPRVAAGRSW